MAEYGAASGILTRRGGATIAYERIAGERRAGHGPGIVFLHGFHSTMRGDKALALEAFCRERGLSYVRYDSFGHGQSSGAFEDGTIGLWREDALAVIDELTEGPQILVGSSMGGWLMLLAALARPERIAGLVGIAAAPDFTEELMWAQASPEQRRVMMENGRWEIPDHFGGPPMVFTRALIEDGRDHLIMGGAIPLACPVRLLQGQQDAEVPWQTALRLSERIESPDVAVTLIKSGAHRLSRPEDLAVLTATLDELIGRVGATPTPATPAIPPDKSDIPTPPPALL